MKTVKDLKWHKGIDVEELVDAFGGTGFQSIELNGASDIFVKMKKSNAKIFLAFTSNMVTSGLRGFFAQLINLGMADIIITTAGSIEEDIMKALGEKFEIASFFSDDVKLHERGENRIGNLVIRNESYMKFEDKMKGMLQRIYEKQKRISVSELIKEIGLMLDDNDSILYQAARKNIPIFCPAITDGAIGFHLFMFQQDHKDFIVDVVQDFSNAIFCTTHDEKKGLIALGGSISKHHAVLIGLMNGGFDYAVYMTTAHQTSGSMSGATTQEAKSWGKIKDDSDAATVIGDVTVMFPLAMMGALEKLTAQGIIKG